MTIHHFFIWCGWCRRLAQTLFLTHPWSMQKPLKGQPCPAVSASVSTLFYSQEFTLSYAYTSTLLIVRPFWICPFPVVNSRFNPKKLLNWVPCVFFRSVCRCWQLWSIILFCVHEEIFRPKPVSYRLWSFYIFATNTVPGWRHARKIICFRCWRSNIAGHPRSGIWHDIPVNARDCLALIGNSVDFHARDVV